MIKSVTATIAVVATVSFSAVALAAITSAQRAVFDQYIAEAKAADPGFAGFSAERGKTFFREPHTGGKPKLNVCTTCHTTDLTKTGKTRAGKTIEPMAASVNSKRYTDRAEVEKWFRRNCNTVLGRECTLTQKGDVLAYLLSL
jgi:cytochrome c553